MSLHLTLVQSITFVASSLGLLSHGAQLYKSLKSRSIKGLSLPSFVLLTATFSLSVLLGIQYKVGPGLVLAIISAGLTVAVLGLISRRVLLAYLAIVAAVIGGVLYGPAAFADAVLTTRFAEAVAFAWGLLFAIAFVPQVIKARRIRDTRDLSLAGLVMSGLGISLWIAFAVLVKNLSMLFWLSVVMISLCELLRLKLVDTLRRPQPSADGPAAASDHPQAFSVESL